MSHRIGRVAHIIRDVVSDCVTNRISDPRVSRFTSVTRVEVSPDLSHAKIFFTHLPGKEHAPAAIEALQHSAGYLRTELSHRLQLYSVPQLHFVYDDSIESGLRLSSLIDDAIAWARGQQATLLEVVVAPNEHDVSHLLDFYAAHAFRDEGRRLLALDL